MSDIFIRIVLAQAPRIIGFLDRTPESETYGCFERYYWHYKLIDFPNARFQEGALLLALLFKSKAEENLFYQNENIHDWCIAAIKFWARARNRNGSVNEVYPFENSFCATAMSALAISQALPLLEKKDLIDLRKTGEWLAKNDNLEVSNQQAAAAAALLNIYFLSGEARFLEAAEQKLSVLLKCQEKSGFFPEYGGFDIGYQSLTLSLLTKYYKRKASDTLLNSIREGIHFILSYLNDKGHYDPAITSRKTQFLYTYAFSVFDKNALQKAVRGLEANAILNPSWLDDRYVIPLTIDYLESYLEEKK
ncbi:MAG: hypothetical protein PHQ96_00040 [Candidatus Omnitrophica bacterium]|nr:hypothetical protein [Candidatus Omnitrophota bacterium]